jgi:hypothetical protein
MGPGNIAFPLLLFSFFFAFSFYAVRFPNTSHRSSDRASLAIVANQRIPHYA